MKKTAVRPFTSPLKNHSKKTNKICGTLLEKQERTHVTFFYRSLHIDVRRLTDLQEHIYISSVRTQDVFWKTCLERWMIETDGETDRERETDRQTETDTETETERGRDREWESQGNPCCQRNLIIMMTHTLQIYTFVSKIVVLFLRANGLII